MFRISRLGLSANDMPFCNRIRAFNPVRLLASDSTNNPKEHPPNSSLKVLAVYNRNPRNLEKLRIAAKPSGWYLDKPGRCFWNKVTLDISSKHITGKVLHFHGYVPVVASTREWSIQKHLYSTRDSAAAEAVGSVFAQRCIESGILELYCGFTETDKKKQLVAVFVEALEEAGLVLKEPEGIKRSDFLQYPHNMDRPWEFNEDSETGEIRQETPISTECAYKVVNVKPLR